MTTPRPLQTHSLYFTHGGSDKEYHAQLVPAGADGYLVCFQYGRRGSTLTAGQKTPQPVPLATAQTLYEKLIKEKLGKGYTPGASGVPYHGTDHQARVTGLQPQLLNPIPLDAVPTYLQNDWWAQIKENGERVQIRKRGDEILGSNKKGLARPLPEPIVQAIRLLPHPELDLDGECVGQTYRAFDLLQGRHDLRDRPYRDRFEALCELGLFRHQLGQDYPTLCIVATAHTPAEKAALYAQLQALRAEGIVFKNPTAAYTAGRPSSGGDQVKYKFVATDSFLVIKHNTKRSVGLQLLDAQGQPVSCGNVTIPVSQPIPAIGHVIDVQYLYAFETSHHLHQPVYIRPRPDVDPADCLLTQLKYHGLGTDDADENS